MISTGWILGAMIGCGAELPDPAPAILEPEVAYNGDLTALTIRGDNFYPLVEVDARSRGVDAEVNAGFRVRFEGPVDATSPSRVEREATFVDFKTLVTSVEPGLRPGDYDVYVEGPTGRSGMLPRGLSVTDVLADRLLVTAPDLLVQVNRTAYVTVELLDREGDRVPDDFGVVIDVLDAEGKSLPVVFEADGLSEQEEDGLGVSGALRDGVAVVGFIPTEPGRVTIEAHEQLRSSVAGGEASLLVTTGDEFNVEVVLPSEPLAVTAGESFPATLRLEDQFGNLVESQPQLLVVGSSCGDWSTSLTLAGERDIDVLLQRATGTPSCPEQRIRVFGAVGGKSTPIQVGPATAIGFTVETGVKSLTAGEGLVVSARPVDTFGNLAQWDGSAANDLLVTDSLGGLRNPSCSGSVFLTCFVNAVRSGPAVTVTVSDSVKGLSGVSPPFEVTPDVPASVDVEVGGAEHVAGAALDVEVSVRDEWGNLVPPTELLGSVALNSNFESPVCVPTTGPSDAVWRSCVLNKASSAAQVEARYTEEDSESLVGISEPFTVFNGPLNRVQLTPLAGSVGAGNPLDVTLQAFDAFDNPYLRQVDPVVRLSDSGGTWSIPEATLDAGGGAVVAGTFERAGQTEVIATQGGVERGRSSPVVVLPGATVALGVDAPPWAWSGEPVDVSVFAEDAFGNVASFDGSGTLSAQSGSVVDVPVVLSAGRGVVEMIWTDVVLDERVDVEVGSFSGQSEPFPVVNRCETAPVAVLRADGELSDASVCLDQSRLGTVSLDMTGSSLGSGRTAHGFFAQDPKGLAVRSSTGLLDLELEGLGPHSVQGLVVQDDGCAAERVMTVWGGPEAGGATGPLDVRIDDEVLDLASSTTVRVTGAVRCDGSSASGDELRLRTDRGELEGVVSTGRGLAITLDPNGDGVATLSAVDLEQGGGAKVTVWAPSWTAAGSQLFNVNGDEVAPVVWEMSPSGDTAGPVSVVELWLSEPLAAVNLSDVGITGPEAAGLLEVRMEEGGRRVVLVPDESLDASLGTWQVTLRSTVADLHGNALDGRWGGSPTNFVGTFGALPGTNNAVIACGVAPSRFAPDGDFGSGDQADEVTVSFEAGVEPAWWVVSVLDTSGEVVRRDRVDPLGAVDTWVWDGRDSTGRVVGNGVFSIQVDTDDGLGNSGGLCAVAATVASAERP